MESLWALFHRNRLLRGPLNVILNFFAAGGRRRTGGMSNPDDLGHPIGDAPGADQSKRTMAASHVGKLRDLCAPPDQWDQLPLTSNWIYAHQQWRPPDRHVGMGVAYMHTRILFVAQTLIWFAKAQYASSETAPAG